MTTSEPGTKSELPRNVTPLESDRETDSKVKKLAMKFDQTSSGRQSSTDKELIIRQPQTEDNPSHLFINVLEDEENGVKF